MSHSCERPPTVAELIEQLSKFAPDMPVLVAAYGGGYQSPIVHTMPTIHLDEYEDSYTGCYWHAWKGDDGFVTLVIDRYRDR